VHFIDPRLRCASAWLAGMSLLAGCSAPPPPPPPSPAAASASVPRSPPARSTPTVPAPVVPSPHSAASPRLPAPGPVRNWAEVRRQAALRMVAANPDGTYVGAVPEPLLAIPVLEIELNADGSIRAIVVLRRPREALDTLQLAIDAVRRAAPFGDVSRLPRPWHFTETFLFDDTRRFKPRSLD
jgi:hypothetical protein